MTSGTETKNEPNRILVVDDDQMVRELIVKILKRSKDHVISVEHGRHAFEKLSTEHFDLMVLDLRMPIMDGPELMAQLKAEDIQINTIILTGHGDLAEAHALLMEYNIADFIQKPLSSPFQLSFSVKNAIEKHRIEKENRAQRNLIEQTNQKLLKEIEIRKQAERALTEKKEIIAHLLRESVKQSKELLEANSRLEAQREALVQQKSQILKQNQEEALQKKVAVERNISNRTQNLKGLQVLLVDEDPRVSDLIRAGLRRTGTNLDLVNHLDQTLERTDSNIQLLLIDYSYCLKDQFKVLQHWHEQFPTKRVLIMMDQQTIGRLPDPYQQDPMILTIEKNPAKIATFIEAETLTHHYG